MIEAPTIKAVVFDAYGTLFDVQSVAAVTDAAFPGHGEAITQIWRLKQLEYSWLRALMNDYRDFWTVTQDALAYTLKVLGLTPTPRLLADVAEAYNRLAPYPEARAALEGLAGVRRAILSNGSPDMLAALVGGSELAPFIEATLSVDERRVFKPDPRAYGLVEEKLGVKPHEVVFVSSNGFDVAGAKRFGFRVARIERLPAQALASEIAVDGLPPAIFFKALRTQEEELGYAPDIVVSSLTALTGMLGADRRGEPVRAGR